MKKADGFLLFLKAFSWETDLLVTLGDFTVKNVKLGREICVELKINLVETKCGVRWLNTIISVTYVEKDFYIRTLIRQLLTKYQFFKKLPQISHTHKNCKFKSIIGLFFRPTASTLEILLQWHVRNVLFIFASCEPLSYYDLFVY